MTVWTGDWLVGFAFSIKFLNYSVNKLDWIHPEGWTLIIEPGGALLSKYQCIFFWKNYHYYSISTYIVVYIVNNL